MQDALARELASAVAADDYAAVSRQLAAGRSARDLINLRSVPFGRNLIQPALLLAAAGGWLNALRAMIDAGADVNERFKDLGGMTALHSAVRYGREHAVALLLAAGADPSAADGGGKTPLGCVKVTPGARQINEELCVRLRLLLRAGGASAQASQPETEEEAIELAKSRERKYRRAMAVVSFTDEAGGKRYRVYLLSEQHRALKSCRVGETPRLVGRVLRNFGYLPETN